MSKRLMTGLYWLMACEFALGAVTKFWPGDTVFSSAYSVKFVDWGYPAWMRFVVGALEGAAAVLLVIPNRRARFLGVTTLMFVLTGAATTHIVNHDPAAESWAAPTHLVIMGILALANWPADWRDLLRAPATPAAQAPRRSQETTRARYLEAGS
ncbi:DoxX family protein [Streptomyces sp. NBC_00572]|uniref:DoxX family protein n=1 Tax=Streptomyces sp. NBC_00572 TaxID=2903664 RepID=UPI00224EB034|nr:DoxX family protein [Streptomyces sp. NBC_00572]MCX4985915.1 DoxX family protein [Streptomyces sp. NBC_00572]